MLSVVVIIIRIRMIIIQLMTVINMALGVGSQIVDSYPDKNTNANDNDNNSHSRRGKGKTWGLCNCGEVTPLVNIFYF